MGVKKNMNKEEDGEEKSEDINGQTSIIKEDFTREDHRKRAEEAQIRILERIRLREVAQEEKKLEERKAQLRRDQESRAEQTRREERGGGEIERATEEGSRGAADGDQTAKGERKM